jgi:AP-1-like factor
MRDLEQQLGELESRHNDLSQSYESLQAEYSNVKVELERLRKDSNVKSDCSPENTSRDYGSDSQQDWEQSRAEIVEPLFFDVSAFCYDHGESGYRKD